MATDRTLANLRKRLDRWELDHLRALASQLQSRVERLENELELARDDAIFWNDQVHHLMHEVRSAGETVGMTKDGQIGIVGGAN